MITMDVDITLYVYRQLFVLHHHLYEYSDPLSLPVSNDVTTDIASELTSVHKKYHNICTISVLVKFANHFIWYYLLDNIVSHKSDQQ